MNLEPTSDDSRKEALEAMIGLQKKVACVSENYLAKLKNRYLSIKQAVFAHYFLDDILLFLFYIWSHCMFRLYFESAIIRWWIKLKNLYTNLFSYLYKTSP
jgi:hypothetical protein